MIKGFIHASLFLATILLSSDVWAQSREYWVQLKSYSQLSLAQNFVNQYKDQLQNLRIYKSAKENYLVVTGIYSRRVATQERTRLFEAGIVDHTSGITTGQHFRDQLWPIANPELPQTSSKSYSLNYDDAVSAQIALDWLGYYDGAIDGIIGSESLAAFQSFQRRNGLRQTGQLTQKGLNQLVDMYKIETEAIGLSPEVNLAAGISVNMPTKLVSLSEITGPFVHYKSKPNSGLQIYLISLSGNYLMFETIYSSLKSHQNMFPEATGSFGQDKFTISSEGLESSAFVVVRRYGNRIKGFIMYWESEEDALMKQIARSMSSSLEEISESTLSLHTNWESGFDISDSQASNGGDPSQPIINLNLPKPRITVSGFYIDPTGTVATSSAIAKSCSRIMLNQGYEMVLGAVDELNGIALIIPTQPQIPISHAMFRQTQPARSESVTLSGYSFGGELDFPSQTSGIWNGPDPRNSLSQNRSELALIDADAFPGDIGGPIFDKSGRLAGILVEKLLGKRKLPEGIHAVAPSNVLNRLASSIGISTLSSIQTDELNYYQQARLANEMTVLVECY